MAARVSAGRLAERRRLSRWTSLSP